MRQSVKFHAIVDRLCVLSGPGTTYEVVRELQLGEEVEVVGMTVFGEMWLSTRDGNFVCYQLSGGSPLMTMGQTTKHPVGFNSPVGSLEERHGKQVWPGKWTDATPFLKLYSGGYHPGAEGQARVIAGTLRVRRSPYGQIVRTLKRGDVVDVYDISQLDTWARIAPNEFACIQNRDGQYMEMIAPPSPGMGFDSPVGTAEERASGDYPPGAWVDANPYGTQNTTGYHTGNDLNLNLPGDWNADRREKVHAIKGGTVRHAGLLPGTWGLVVVIEHDPVGGKPCWSRYAHLREGTLQVQAGQVVETGQELGMIGPFNGDEELAHLHFDIARTNILSGNPGHWPGADYQALIDNYVDPVAFFSAAKLPAKLHYRSNA